MSINHRKSPCPPSSQKNNRRYAKIKYILFSILLLLIIPSLLYSNWVLYVFHLAKHQYYVLSHQYEIRKIIIDKQYCIKHNLKVNDKIKISLELITKIQNFGKITYNLKASQSYTTFTPLDRKELGWNLTVAEPLKLELKQFSFPIVGKFGYLGFFEPLLLKQWEHNFRIQGYDTYRFTIGAYSTTGYFSDPVFSTYLNQSSFAIASLILHEMAHEKLYFKNDSNFSESLASFIDDRMAMLYFNIPPNKHTNQYKEEYNILMNEMEQAQIQLQKIFNSNDTDIIKKQLKKKVYEQLKINLREFSTNFKLISLQKLLDEEFNNAFLLNFKRYTPKTKGFEKLLTENCNNNIECWFNNLAVLTNCSVQYRQKFLETGILNNNCK